MFTKSNHWMSPILSLRQSRDQQVPDSSNHSLDLMKLLSSSYFKGNYGGNQLRKSGKVRKTGASALCTMDDTCCFLDIRLGPKTSRCVMSVNVKTTVGGCEGAVVAFFLPVSLYPVSTEFSCAHLQPLDVTQNVFRCAVHNRSCEPFSLDPTWAPDV